MLLRRVIEHVKAQNWTAVGLDFVIVVMGVYLGIQVNNWDQSRSDRDVEVTYLELLQSDLRSTIKDVNEQIAFEQIQVEQANAAGRLIGQPPSEIRRRKLGMILGLLGARRTLKIDSPTFLDLQSSGKLGLIADPDLRNDVVAYFFRIDRWESVIEKNNEYFVDRSFNDLLDGLSIGYWLWDREVMGGPSSMEEGVRARLLVERLDEALVNRGGAVLMSPPEAELWQTVLDQLGTRAGISVTNESFAISILEATTDLEAKIAAYLEERK